MDTENSMSMSLTRFLSGDALPEEAMQIDQWIRTSDTNRKVYGEFLSLWYAKSNQKYSPVSASRSWDDLRRQLTLSDSVPRRINRPWNWAIAASLIITSTLVAIVMYFSSSSKIQGPVSVIHHQATDQQPVYLPDSSTVFLDRGAMIQRPQKFENGTRTLSLSGSAYFQVEPDKLRPFRIITKKLIIEVVGTSFAITRDSLTERTQVAVESGIVRVSSSRESVDVRAGQTVDFSEVENSLMLLDSIDINSFSYATHRFSFRDLSLKQITEHLQKVFGATFSFSQPGLEQCRMSADFDNESLDYIANVIASTLNLKYTIGQNTVYFSGDVCK